MFSEVLATYYIGVIYISHLETFTENTWLQLNRTLKAREAGK